MNPTPSAVKAAFTRFQTFPAFFHTSGEMLTGSMLDGLLPK